MYNGKGRMSDIDRERKYRLRQIKKKHKPINFEALKHHEKSFLSAIQINRINKKEELHKKLAHLQKSYCMEVLPSIYIFCY